MHSRKGAMSIRTPPRDIPLVLIWWQIVSSELAVPFGPLGRKAFCLCLRRVTPRALPSRISDIKETRGLGGGGEIGAPPGS